MTPVLGCGDGTTGTVFGDVQWQVQCPRDLAGCSRNGADNDVFDFDGNNGVRAECALTDLDDGNRALSFTVAKPGVSLSVQSAIVSPAGGVIVSPACRLTVTDDSVTYGGRMQGGCGTNAPSDAQPCQLGPIVFEPNGESGPEVRTSILCDNVAAEVDPTRFIRNVRAPNRPNDPAPVRMINCQNF